MHTSIDSTHGQLWTAGVCGLINSLLSNLNLLVGVCSDLVFVLAPACFLTV